MVIGRKRLTDPVSFPRERDEWHHFLKTTTQHWGTQDATTPDYDRVDLALRLRNHMENMPKTSATFRLSDAIDGDEAKAVTEELMHFLGSWKIPERYTDAREQSYINPHYQFAHHFSDAAVWCGCGTLAVREAFSEQLTQPAQSQDHAENCHKIHRHEYRAELLRNKRRIIKEMALLGHSFREMAQRLGYKVESDIAPTLAENVGLDTSDLIRRGRGRTARTMLVLSREYRPTDIGRLYDVDSRTVSTIIGEETDSDPSVLYSVRRRFGAIEVPA